MLIPTKIKDTLKACSLKRVYNPENIDDNLYLLADAIQNLQNKQVEIYE